MACLTGRGFSVATIAQSLRVLEMTDCGITTVAHLCYL